MKAIKLIIFGTLAVFFIQSCTDKTEAAIVKKEENYIDTTNIGCLASYDINPVDNKGRINQVYGKEKIKDGHWITYGFSVTKANGNKANRIKIEEGYYRKNKKEDYWKFFKDDGTIRDSIEYKNDIAVTNKF